MPSNIKFIRRHGRIIPIRSSVKRAAAVGAVGLAVGGVAGTIVSRKKGGTDPGPNAAYKYGSYALQVASGVVSALPLKGKAGFALSIAGSIGLDAIAAGLNAKSVVNMRGSKWKKGKVFAEQQAVGTAIGYGVFGAGLIARRDVRSKVASTTSSVINKARKWML